MKKLVQKIIKWRVSSVNTIFTEPVYGYEITLFSLFTLKFFK